MTGSVQGLLMVGAGSTPPPPVVFVPPVWGSTILPASMRWRGSAASPTMLVVGGIDPNSGVPCSAYSTDDGQHWTMSPTSFPYMSGYAFNEFNFAYGDGVFVAGVNYTQMLRSIDGINWSVVAGSSFDKRTVVYAPGNGFFMLCGNNDNILYTSPDGSAYLAQTLVTTINVNAAAEDFSTKRLYLAGSSNVNMTKPFGGAWTVGGVYPWVGGTEPRTMAAGNDIVVLCPYYADTRVAYSINHGVTWQYSNVINASAQLWYGIEFINSAFYLMNSGGNLAYVSYDGNTWTAVSAASGLIGSQGWATNHVGGYVSCGESGSSNYIVGYAPAGPAAPVNPLPALSLDTTTSASSSVTLTGDGKLEVTGTGSTVAAPANWFNLQKYNIGVSYWVRLTVLSGDNPQPGHATNTWLNIGSGKAWVWLQNDTATAKLEVASDAAGTNIVATEPSFNIVPVVIPAGVLTPLQPVTLDDYGFATTASAAVELSTNGLMIASGSASYIPAPSAWYNPLIGSIGNSYWVRLTVNSGSNPNMVGSEPINTWNQLSGPITWGWSRSAIGGTFAECTYEIASDSSGTNIVSAGTISVQVEYDE
jgi:hypothetical protein